MSQAAVGLTRAGEVFPVIGLDHIEFYVGNARQAAHFYRSALGMELVAYQGPETGIHDRASYVVSRGKIRFVLTAALRPNHPIADHVYRYGDGVRSIALTVPDAKAAFFEVKQRGARIAQDPLELRDEYGTVRSFALSTCGETIHTLVERDQYNGIFLPGFTPMTVPDRMAYVSGIERVHQLTLSPATGAVDGCVGAYEAVLDFEHSGGGKLQKRALDGEVIRFRVEGRGEDLGYLGGAGVSQIALATSDLAGTVSTMLSHGVEFHQTGHGEDREEVFVVTKPVEDRPTLSFLIIEQKRPVSR